MTWCVVHFTAEQTVEVVPKSWTIESQKCYWPNGYNRKKILEAVKFKESPGCNWSIFSIKVLGTYEDLMIAQIKCNRAKDRDDLSSSSDELALGKGLRYKKTRILGDFDCSLDEVDEYPVMPPIPTAEGLSRNEICQKGKMSESRRIQEAYSLESEYLPEQSINKKIQQPVLDQSNKDFRKEFQDLHSQIDDVSSALAQLTVENGEFQRQVMRQLHILNARLKEVMENQEVFMKNNINNENAVPHEFSEQTEEIMNIFPIRNLHDVNRCEDILKNPQQMNIIAKELSRLGGATVKEIVKRIMFSVINNETAQLYSWEGQKGKQKFKDLVLGKLIIKAVRLNEKTKEASEADIIKPLREWLVRAKFRRVQSNSQPADEAN